MIRIRVGFFGYETYKSKIRTCASCTCVSSVHVSCVSMSVQSQRFDVAAILDVCCYAVWFLRRKGTSDECLMNGLVGHHDQNQARKDKAGALMTV